MCAPLFRRGFLCSSSKDTRRGSTGAMLARNTYNWLTAALLALAGLFDRSVEVDGKDSAV